MNLFKIDLKYANDDDKKKLKIPSKEEFQKIVLKKIEMRNLKGGKKWVLKNRR